MEMVTQEKVKEAVGSTLNIALNGYKDNVYSQQEAECQIYLDVWKFINSETQANPSDSSPNAG